MLVLVAARNTSEMLLFPRMRAETHGDARGLNSSDGDQLILSSRHDARK